MSDETLMEPFAVPEYFIEGSISEVRGSSFHRTYYRVIDGHKVATVRIITPMEIVDAVREEIDRVLHQASDGTDCKLINLADKMVR